jgi:biotin carboxyl carrier protein
MEAQFKIEDLLSRSYKMEKISDSIYNVDGEIIEVLEVNLDLKKIKVRHNHTTHQIQFKNDLDLTLEKMGIKRTFETVNTDIKAPMPGKVLDVMIKPGDTIEKGQPILILEAMKMENVLKADGPSKVKTICVSTHDSVESGQLLVELDPIA